MISLFSPFDAFCAESLGYNTSHYPRVCPAAKEAKPDASVSPPVKATEDAPTVTPPAAKESKPDASVSQPVKAREDAPTVTPPEGGLGSQKQQQRKPKFAPELDGIFCFETIIRY